MEKESSISSHVVSRRSARRTRPTTPRRCRALRPEGIRRCRECRCRVLPAITRPAIIHPETIRPGTIRLGIIRPGIIRLGIIRPETILLCTICLGISIVCFFSLESSRFCSSSFRFQINDGAEVGSTEGASGVGIGQSRILRLERAWERDGSVRTMETGIRNRKSLPGARNREQDDCCDQSHHQEGHSALQSRGSARQ